MQPPPFDFDQMNEDLERDRPLPGDEVLDPGEKLPVGETGERTKPTSGFRRTEETPVEAETSMGFMAILPRETYPNRDRTHYADSKTTREDRRCLNYNTPQKEPLRARERSAKNTGQRKEPRIVFGGAENAAMSPGRTRSESENAAYRRPELRILSTSKMRAARNYSCLRPRGVRIGVAQVPIRSRAGSNSLQFLHRGPADHSRR